MTVETLKSSWDNLLQKSQVKITLREVIFNDLVNAYSNLARHYHNLEHIQYLLSLSKMFSQNIEQLIILQFSAWFHDYIYNPQAQDNELRSAVYAEGQLNKLNISSDVIQLIKQIILSTKKHQPLTNNVNNAIFLDMDLSILAVSSDNYLKYSQAIRQEYIWLSDRDYHKGRKKVLSSFLARERIYFTEYFHQKLETKARINLKSEIKNLTFID